MYERGVVRHVVEGGEVRERTLGAVVPSCGAEQFANVERRDTRPADLILKPENRDGEFERVADERERR